MLLFGAGLDVYIDFLSNTVILEIGLTDTHSITLSWSHCQDLSADHLLGWSQEVEGHCKMLVVWYCIVLVNLHNV